jgi:hypothetical protein
MGYWDASDLAQYAPRPNLASVMVTASSVPVNLGQLQELIEERSGEFDQAAAKAGYLVPIPTTASQGYMVARRVVRDGTLADLMRTWPTGDPKSADRYQAAFDKAMTAIEQGDRPIPNAPTDPTGGGRLLPVAGGGWATPVITASLGGPANLSIPNDW